MELTVWEQFLMIVRSRKFWALVASLVAIWTEYFATQTPDALSRAVNLTVAALGAYAIGVGLEGQRRNLPDGLEGPKQPRPS